MMKRNILILISVLAISLLTSCFDALDKEPNTAIPEPDALHTLEDAEQHLTGIYSVFLDDNLYSGALTLLPDIQSDFMYSVIGFSNTYGDIYRWEIHPSNNYIQSIYANLYVIIKRCNFYLENIDRVRESLKSKTDINRLDRYTGEVYLARALAYSEVIKLWCDAYDPQNAANQLGVQITDSYSDTKKVLRSNLKDSYEFVLTDLGHAESLMDELGLTTDVASTMYFSPQLVNALRARLYLYMSDYDNAIKYATEVIEDGKYSLAEATAAMSGSNMSEYTYMWGYDDANEIIWKVGMTNTDYGASLSRIFHKYDYISYTPDYVPAQWILNAYGNGDYRYNSFFYYTTTGYDHQLAWPIMVKYYSNPVIDGSGNPLFRNMPKVFRLSEQYLIRAEAYYHKNRADSANMDLTTLRKKRIVGYGTANHSGDALFDQIKLERAKELYMEGFRLNDLKRWKMGFTREAQLYTNDGPNKLSIQAGNPLFVWPIPQHEIDANPDIQKNPSNN